MEKRKSGKMVMQKKVITETISSRRRHKSGDRYQYITDIWEKNPKTDYTYSRSGSYASLYLRKGYVSPNMSRRSMHRDSTHSETHSNSSVIVHQDTTTTDRLNYSSDDASDDESSQDSARAVKSTSSSVRSRKSISDQSFSHNITPSNSRLERTFSDSTTRQGTAYGIGWTIDTKGRRRRIKGLPRVARGEVQELIDSQQQNTENSRQEYEEYEDGSEKDKRIRYLYDESDDEDHPDGFQFNNEPVVPTVITTVTTVITSVITQLFCAPVRTVASQLQFMSNRQRTGSNENLSLFGWLCEIISTVMLAVFSLISAPVYGFWYVFTKLHEGLYNLTRFSLRTLSEGLFNMFMALYDASSYASHLLLEGLYYGVNTLRESSNILLSVVSGLWSLPAVIFRCITFILIGLYKSVESATRGAQSMISDGLFGLWNALCHGTAYIINGVCYPLTAITSGFRQFTSGLFRVDEDEEISQMAQVQYDSSMIEETNRPLGSFGANIGTKYGTSSARRRSSKRLRLSGKRADDEIMGTEDNLNLTRSISKSSWLSWLRDKTSAGQIEVGTGDKKSETFLVTMDNDAEDDNIGLWLLNGIHKIFVFLLSPLSGLLSWLCWRVGSGAYGSIAEAVQSDVWLLSRTSRLRRRYGCCCLLLLLLLVPFVLASVYYIRERGVAFPPFPILAANDSGCCVIQQGTNITDEDLKDKVQTILVGLLADQERRQQQLYANQHKEMNEIQATALVNHRVELEKWVHSLLKDEFAAFATAQSNKEQDYVRAREAAEAAAARSEVNKADKDYTHLATQINQMGTKNEGIVADLGAQIAALQTKADALSQELSAAEASGKQLVGAEREAREEAIVLLKDQLTSLRSDVASLEAAQAVLLGRMSECCKNDSALLLLIKEAVQDEMALLMGGSSGGGGWFGGGSDAASSGGFMGWLSSRFAQRDDVDAKIAALAARLTDRIEAIPVTNAQGQPDMMYLHDGVELNAQQVRVMIREALLLYGADKTGQPDYALESAGGSVISTRCSETYHRRTAQLSLFGIPLWYASNSPRSVIQPDVHPGQCWAFKGTQGYLVIQLSGEIYPTAFALEHIPKGLSPTGNIDSAPKDFSVSGLTSERETEGILLGNFTYREDGEPLQHFAAKEPSTRSFPYVELRIHSNHGNPEYTCLYRFRVHGNLKRW